MTDDRPDVPHLWPALPMVYGTNGFDIALLDLSDRMVRRDLVGVDAEHLVYLCGACDRRRTWRGPAWAPIASPRVTGVAAVAFGGR